MQDTENFADNILQHFQSLQEAELGFQPSAGTDQTSTEVVEPQRNYKKPQSVRYKEKYLEEKNRADSTELDVLKLQQENLELKKGWIHKDLETTYETLTETIEREKQYNQYNKQLIEDKIDARYKGDAELERDLELKQEDLRELLLNIKEEKKALSSDYSTLYNQYQNEEGRNPTQNSKSYPTDFEELLKKYPMFDHRNNNPDYSPEALAKLNEISAKLTHEYKKNGRKTEVWTADFYDDLDSKVAQEFSRSNRNQTQSPRIVSTPVYREDYKIDSPQENLVPEAQAMLDSYATSLNEDQLKEIRKNLLAAQRKL